MKRYFSQKEKIKEAPNFVVNTMITKSVCLSQTSFTRVSVYNYLFWASTNLHHLSYVRVAGSEKT